MEPMEQQWERIGELFEAALDLPSAERGPWLREMCDGDASLLREVELMLEASEKSRGILERPELLRPLSGTGSEALQPFDETYTHPTLPMTRHKTVNVEEVGPYRLLKEIGQGGMGVVYKAHDPRLDRYVALKFLPEPLQDKPNLEKRFLAEAKAASSLHHPNICTIYDIGQTQEGLRYIAMAFYDGETLSRRLVRGSLEVKEALILAIQIGEGLAASHEAGIVHRDIKPSNIMVTEGGDPAISGTTGSHIGLRATILDFGVAKLEGSTRATAPGTLVGTVSYMSPERLLGGEADHRGDLWSLGVVLFEMLTGSRPFRGDHPIAILQGILHREPPSLLKARPDAPEALAAIVRKALMKTQEDRYQSAREMVADLMALREALSQSEGAAALPAPEVRPALHLPSILTSFLGREGELAECRALLAASRLLTLTGAAGTGKTRLAIELARMAAADFADGVLFVELAPIREPALVASAIARQLGLAETASRDTLEILKETLQNSELLLLLDNFEQVAAAANVVAALLAAAPRLKIVVTSRVILHLSGEQSFPVPTLGLPEGVLREPELLDTQDCVDAISTSAATALFVERARAANPAFDLDRENARAVAEICARLDGLPLAIELAAARIRLFKPETLLARLGERLDLLKTGARDQPERHRTLRHAVAWSYELLSEDEQAFFRRLAVFTGGATLDAAEEVVGELGIDAVDGIETLLDHSLIQRQETPSGDPRFRMLETMLEFGREASEEAGEWASLQIAHALYFLRLAEDAAPNLTGPDLGIWLGRLEVEHDNLRAAASWAVENGKADVALRLTVALWRFWLSAGFMNEGRRRLESALALPGAEPRSKALALHALGTVTNELGQTATALPLLQEALEIWRQLDDRHGMATILTSLGWLAIERSDHAKGRRLSQEGLELHREVDNERGAALALNNLGWAATYEGDLASAEDFLGRSHEIRRKIGDQRGVAFALANLARVAIFRGDFKKANELLEEAQKIAGELQDRLVYPWCVTIQGIGALTAGDLEQALEILEPLEGQWRDLGHRPAMALAQTSRGRAAVYFGDLETAERSLNDALATWRSIGSRWGVAGTLHVQAELAQRRGKRRTAAEKAREALTLRTEFGDRLGCADCCDVLALVFEEDGDAGRAARLLGAADALRAEAVAERPPLVRGDVERLRLRLAEALGETARDAAIAEGRELPRLRLSQELLGS